MRATKLIPAAAGAFLALELGLYTAAFRGHMDNDLTKNNFKSNADVRPYADQVLKGKSYIRNTPHEDVEIRARDGVRLYGRFYDRADRRGIIIMLHGYRSMAENDFSCSARYIHEKGFAMLIVDQRAHGRSGGSTITFGVRERWDAIEWAKYAGQRFPGEKVVLEGLSMGAATVVMAAGEELPECVAGIIADCGYTSPKEIISSVIESKHLPAKVFYPLVRLSGRIFGGFDCEECSAVESAKKARVPAVFIHGEADKFVPCQMGRENYDAYAGEKLIVTVPGAAHGLSYVVDTPKCQAALEKFLDNIL